MHKQSASHVKQDNHTVNPLAANNNLKKKFPIKLFTWCQASAATAPSGFSFFFLFSFPLLCVFFQHSLFSFFLMHHGVIAVVFMCVRAGQSSSYQVCPGANQPYCSGEASHCLSFIPISKLPPPRSPFHTLKSLIQTLITL